MAITPSQPTSGKGMQIAKFVENSTDKAQKKRLRGETLVEQQRVRQKPTRKQQRKQAEKSAQRRGQNLDVRA